MKIRFENKRFHAASLTMIGTINEIIREYQRQGFDLTVRQLYYQLVARDIIPNNEKSYKRTTKLVSNGRLAGLIDWGAILDRTRSSVKRPEWEGEIPGFLKAVLHQYKHDLWVGQSTYVEVWVEKEALAGVIEDFTYSRGLTSFACRGYVSSSAMFQAASRIRGQVESDSGRQDKDVVILHLGDHDPSGIDMTRDIEDRMRMFLGGGDTFESPIHVEVKRIALNMDQVLKHGPPPNPAKSTDSRYKDYRSLYGNESWELDALNPSTLQRLIREALGEHMDMTLYDKRKALEMQRIESLREVARAWPNVVDSSILDAQHATLEEAVAELIGVRFK